VKILVTGSSGFIGSHLTETLMNRGHDVSILLRKTSRREWTRNLSVRPVTGDYADPENLRSCVAGMDIVFHLAAVLKASNWETYYRANTLATQHLLEACAAANPALKRFVFVSSIAAAGPTFNKIFRDESNPSRPDSFYGKSKLLAEKFVLGFQNYFPVTIARPSNVIGIRQQELLMIIKLLKKRIYPLLGNGDYQTSLCFVQDLVEAFIVMSKKAAACSQTYYITDNKGYAWHDILEIISRFLGVYPLMVKIPYPLLLGGAKLSEAYASVTRQKPLLASRYIRSTRYHYHLFRSDKIQRELGFKTKTSFLQGIKDIIHWYEQHGIL
jgi:nucleoside-diphosphate-sugar epimerase